MQNVQKSKGLNSCTYFSHKCWEQVWNKSTVRSAGIAGINCPLTNGFDVHRSVCCATLLMYTEVSVWCVTLFCTRAPNIIWWWMCLKDKCCYPDTKCLHFSQHNHCHDLKSNFVQSIRSDQTPLFNVYTQPEGEQTWGLRGKSVENCNSLRTCCPCYCPVH